MSVGTMKKKKKAGTGPAAFFFLLSRVPFVC